MTVSESMVERVAIAIRSGLEASGMATVTANGPKGEMAVQQFFEVLAMDAIEAMREPTYGMTRCRGINLSNYVENKDCWQEMIDAALSGK